MSNSGTGSDLSLELDLNAAFAEAANTTLPEWLTRADRPIQCFYETMKRWEKLKTKIKELSDPRSLKVIFPILKDHTSHFHEILGFCEARPEMLKMIKTALYGLTFGCFEEQRDQLNIFRYHYALNTVFDLMVIPPSNRCRRPAFMTEDGLVEKGLSATIQNIFKIVLDQMRSEDQDDHIDYMVYACAHFGSPESGYSRASRKAINNAFKDYYAQLPPQERAMIANSIYYKKNATSRDFIDELVTQARTQMATAAFESRLPDRART